jgi:demethylmenaquinone methyltransferase/2-methoxy-6-polyprenyl-1,4-benzoquinol methylase
MTGRVESSQPRVAIPSATKIRDVPNGYVQTSSTPIIRCDADGNTYQQRTLDDGSVYEVLKNFPTRDEALAVLGPRAVEQQWIEHENYWILSYRLA